LKIAFNGRNNEHHEHNERNAIKNKIFRDSITLVNVKLHKMVLSTTKRCQRIDSITNNICNLGGPKKGGLITMQGRNPNLSNAITSRAPYCCVQTNLGCIAGLAYLKAKNLMTMNPAGCGGVPSRMYRPGLF
jgi:hypothetical protein